MNSTTNILTKSLNCEIFGLRNETEIEFKQHRDMKQSNGLCYSSKKSCIAILSHFSGNSVI